MGDFGDDDGMGMIKDENNNANMVDEGME